MNFRTSHLDRLQDYLQSKCAIELTPEEQQYYDALVMTIGVYRKYGRQQAVHFLMAKPFRCSRAVAMRMADDAVNLFYLDDGIERQAWRNLMFEEMRNAALAILRQQTLSADDLEVYGRLMDRAYKFKQLDRPDPEKPKDAPAAGYGEIKVYTLSGRQLGLPEVNRNELAQLIDRLDQPEATKERLRTDAGLRPADLDQLIDDTLAVADIGEK